MRHYFSYLTLLLLLLQLVSCNGLGPQRDIDKILVKFHDAGSEYVMVAAHRAAHNGFPENSIHAIKYAIELDVDILELDVKITKDNVAVLMHDGTINRTTNGTGKVEDYTLSELKSFRLKKGDGTLTNERIPTFEEALNAVYGKAMVDIDIKTGNVKPIVDAVKITNTVDHVFYFDNNYDVLKAIRELDERSMFMPRAYSFEMADSALKVFNPQVVHIDPSFYSGEVTELIRGKNARIWINALGEPDIMIRKGKTEEAVESLLKHNANIIQTDEPELLILYLETTGRRKK